MNLLILILSILICVILLLQLFFILQIRRQSSGTSDHRDSLQASFRIDPPKHREKLNSHAYQVLTGWNEILDKPWMGEISETKDPAGVLKKAIEEYHNRPDEQNAKLLIKLSNHISNRIRYDEKIDGLIEEISELTKQGKK